MTSNGQLGGRSRAPPGQDREEPAPPQRGHLGEQARPEPKEPLVIRYPADEISMAGDRGGAPTACKGAKGTSGEDGGHSTAPCLPVVYDLTLADDKRMPVPAWSSPQIHILFLKRGGKQSAGHFPMCFPECSYDSSWVGFIIFILQTMEQRLRKGK